MKLNNNIILTNSQTNAWEQINSFLSDENSIFILKGYAGTGKTTLLAELVEHLNRSGRPNKVMAPTGRAAKVITDKIHGTAYTIHKNIYAFNDIKEYKIENLDGSESFKYFSTLVPNDDSPNMVYIVDESSMVSDKYSEGEFFRFGSGCLLKDLMQYCELNSESSNRKVIFIGDSAQLPPVNMNLSPAITKEYLSDNYSCGILEYEMHDVVRQKQDSGLLNCATSIRKKINDKNFNELVINTDTKDINKISHNNIVDKFLQIEKENPSEGSVIIAYSNKSVLQYNQAIRERIYPNITEPCAGDKLMIVRNNYVHNILNGEFCKIVHVSDKCERVNVPLKIKNGSINVELIFRDIAIELSDQNGEITNKECKIIENILNSDFPILTREEQRALYVNFKNRHPDLKAKSSLFKKALLDDQYFNALQVKYGYAVTCHKAQGGEWNEAIVDFSASMNDRSETYFRWVYTALTRIKKNIYCINPPNFGIFDKMKVTTTQHVEKNVNQEVSIEVINDEAGGNFEFKNDFQKNLFKLISSKNTSNVKIFDIKHCEWLEKYTFIQNDESSLIEFLYNKKNQISMVRKKTGDSKFDKLFSQLSVLSGSIVHNGNNQNNNQLIMEIDDPILIDFYNSINQKISESDIKIKDITHLPFNEKYNFIRGTEFATINFFYNGSGNFTRIYPEKNVAYSQSLVNHITEILS